MIYSCYDVVSARYIQEMTTVKTLEGILTALPGEWLVESENGNFKIVTDAEFLATYSCIEY